ncbi:NUDIX domain-containing protein [Clostridium gasigenes]|uniref:NUDIX domain-containing protein n=1 Tax=Clostridium gasigenes TaxID=94869 RepID=UPI001C0B3D60|nr:NUDIX hydrolase [Clostridium gasigenes]MBU3106640.1 NUDIX hydrolase [Clostridium gasigenes]
MDLYEKTITERIIHKGNFITYINVDVELPDGKIGNRDIIKHPGACAIIPFIDNQTVILVKQFRKALEKNILEIPAGKLEKGEDPKLCAIRELEEETGYRAENVTFLGTIATAPGFCDELIHLYKATGLFQCEKSLDEDEFTEVKVFTIEEIKSMIKNGEIIDTKTISSLMYL